MNSKSIRTSTYVFGNIINWSDTVELFGITLGRNINFKWNKENICCQANNKTKAPFRIAKFLNLELTQILGEACILSNFSYWPLIWMLCGKISNSFIVKTHYRTIRALYDTQKKSHEELLNINGKKNIQIQSLQLFMKKVNEVHLSHGIILSKKITPII